MLLCFKTLSLARDEAPRLLPGSLRFYFYFYQVLCCLRKSWIDFLGIVFKIYTPFSVLSRLSNYFFIFCRKNKTKKLLSKFCLFKTDYQRLTSSNFDLLIRHLQIFIYLLKFLQAARQRQNLVS